MTKSKDKSIRKGLYIGLALLLLFGVGGMSYAFYQLLRFIAFAGFGYLAYLEYKSHTTDMMILFIVLALLFQPFFPLGLGKVIWKIIDILVAGYLIYLLIQISSKTRNKR